MTNSVSFGEQVRAALCALLLTIDDPAADWARQRLRSACTIPGLAFESVRLVETPPVVAIYFRDLARPEISMGFWVRLDDIDQPDANRSADGVAREVWLSLIETLDIADPFLPLDDDALDVSTTNWITFAPPCEPPAELVEAPWTKVRQDGFGST